MGRKPSFCDYDWDDIQSHREQLLPRTESTGLYDQTTWPLVDFLELP